MSNLATSHQDGLRFRGVLDLHPIRWDVELEVAERLLGAPIAKADPADARRVLAQVAPCIHLEHRGGICPLGRRHDVRHVHLSNTVMDGFYGAILDQFCGVASPADLGADYVAAGTASTATTNGLTQLGSEYYRAVYTDRQRPLTTQGVIYFFFGQTVANTYLHEFAVFAGAATGAANSGLMVCRWLFDFNKDSSTTLNGQYTLQRG